MLMVLFNYLNKYSLNLILLLQIPANLSNSIIKKARKIGLKVTK